MNSISTSILDGLYFFFFGLGILSSIVLLFFFLLKRKVLHRLIYHFFFGKGLIVASKKLATELPGNVSRETLGEIAGQGIIRLTRIGIFALLLGFLPALFLFQQNRLLSNQNELFSMQNKRIEQQTHLLEADRRSSYNYRLNNVLNRIDAEIKEQRDSSRVTGMENHDMEFHLSEPLIGRISALSHAFKPYRFLDGDELIERPISPERGQLLVVLIKSKLDSETMHHIFENVNFQNADLTDCNISKMKFPGVNLAGSNMSKLDLSKTDFSNANLSGVDFTGSNLDGVNLKGTDLTNSILKNTKLDNVNLKEAASLEGVKGLD